jgi:hypothetical protein
VANVYDGHQTETIWFDEALLGYPGTTELIRRVIDWRLTQA